MESNGYQTHFGYHVRSFHIFSHLFIIVSVVASWSWKWKRQVLQETRGEVELSLDWLETLWLHSGQKASILICHSRHFMSNVFKCDQMCVNCKRCVFFSVSLLELLSGYLVFRLLKSFRMPFLANIFFNDLFMIWIRFLFMIFLWVQIVVMIFYGLDMIFFYGFGYDFFMIFFYVFLVLRIWFSAIKTREIFDFFMILLEFPFPQSLFSRKFDFGSKSVKKS